MPPLPVVYSLPTCYTCQFTPPQLISVPVMHPIEIHTPYYDVLPPRVQHPEPPESTPSSSASANTDNKVDICDAETSSIMSINLSQKSEPCPGNAHPLLLETTLELALASIPSSQFSWRDPKQQFRADLPLTQVFGFIVLLGSLKYLLVSK